jgi:hypothetical protein
MRTRAPCQGFLERSNQEDIASRSCDLAFELPEAVDFAMIIIAFRTRRTSPAVNLSVARRLKHNGNSATAASRTHEARFETGQREVRAARAHEGVDVELLSVDAFPDPLHPVARAVGAPHVHLPAEASRDA